MTLPFRSIRLTHLYSDNILTLNVTQHNGLTFRWIVTKLVAEELLEKYGCHI